MGDVLSGEPQTPRRSLTWSLVSPDRVTTWHCICYQLIYTSNGCRILYLNNILKWTYIHNFLDLSHNRCHAVSITTSVWINFALSSVLCRYKLTLIYSQHLRHLLITCRNTTKMVHYLNLTMHSCISCRQWVLQCFYDALNVPMTYF